MAKGINKKAYKVLERIIEICNDNENAMGYEVSFTRDFGGPALTVRVGNSHFHTYPTVTSVDEFIEYLYNNLGKEEEEVE